MTYRFDYQIRPSDPKMPITPIAQVYVKNNSEDEDGKVFVTQEMTLSEIDGTIDHLIAELEEIRKKAKSEMQKEA